MFVGNQNCPGSRGRDFVRSKLGRILINIKKKLFVYTFLRIKIQGQGQRRP